MPSPPKSAPAPRRSFSTSALKERSAMKLFRNQCEHAKRTAGTALDLQRRRNNDRASRRQLIQILEALQAIEPGAVQQSVGRIGRIEKMGLSGVGPDCFHAEAMHM